MSVKRTPEEAGGKSAGYSIYMGPSLKGILQTGTIIPGSVKEALRRPEIVIALNHKPSLKALIVDGADFPKAMAELKTQGSDLYKLYRRIASNED